MIDFRLVRHLHAFLIVAEEGHFGRAAVRLGMSQPPLTQQIQLLEHALGVKLFDRSRRGTILSVHGAAILPTVRRFIDHAARVDGMVRAAKDGKASELRIGAILSVIENILPPIVEKLRQTFPDLSLSIVEIDSYQALELVESGELDAAYARLTRGPEKLDVQLVKKDDLVVALTDSHPFSAHTKIDLANLKEESLILFPRQTAPEFFDSIISLCSSAGYTPRTLSECRSISAQNAMVGCGQGVALIPSTYARALPALYKVIYKPIAQRCDIATISIITKKTRSNEFIDTLIGMSVEPAH